MFQFHKGAIRTEPERKDAGLYCMFQFHKGAIRTLSSQIALRASNSVSIP